MSIPSLLFFSGLALASFTGTKLYIGLPEQVIMNSLNQNTVTFCGRKIFWK